MKLLKTLVGSGDKIVLFLVPFLAAGVILQVLVPGLLALPDSAAVRLAGAILLLPGLVVWAWSAILILARVPQGKLITSGPFALVRHPLYTGVSLLVLPGLGFLLGTWLGLLFGIGLYAGSRLFAPEEERRLSESFGPAWDDYSRRVLMPWL